MSWRGPEARVAAYREKNHGRKSGPGIAVARGEFGELTRGELMRFYCTSDISLIYIVLTLPSPSSASTLMPIILTEQNVRMLSVKVV